MKTVILAGGLGTRLSEETDSRPKPMVEIGGKPILWHIMKIYSSFGLNDFIICCGYKGYVIKEYFANYFIHQSNLTIDLRNNNLTILKNSSEPWSVTLVDTGLNTMTGGRLKRVHEFLTDNEPFCFTYGDGVANIDIRKLISFHNDSKKKATLTAAKAPGRYGSITIDNEINVKSFKEKKSNEDNWVNAGFFVLEKSTLEFIENDNTVWEENPLNTLASESELVAYKHNDFWQPMDTLREKNLLNSLWINNEAPWKIWD